MFQWRLARELERCIRAAEMPNERPVRMSYGSKTSATGLIGRMEIMRAGVSAVVIEGSDAALRRGVGHIPGTSLPGRGRNVRNRWTPGYVFPASAECLSGRHDYVHDVARGVSLQRCLDEVVRPTLAYCDPREKTFLPWSRAIRSIL